MSNTYGLVNSMSPERWQRLQELFNAAMELSPDSRAAFLDHACDGDASLRGEAESLILADDQSTQRIHNIISDAAVETVIEEERPSMEGRLIGPYQVIEQLGHGGMGDVYLAVRADDEYQKRVAIKVVHNEFGNPEILRRFRNERQILAGLDHPYIASLLDGGTTPDGLPYVVMEYVAGEPIDHYCENRQLSIPERLKLFRDVCAAVHYAHQNLVIHRDIKPGNILVTAQGEPKLLDFGIARLLSDDRDHTVTLRAMTPDYASPEQLLGRPITTATDVYSLGVLLYQLLTGLRPQSVVASAPVRPSVCARTPDGAGERAARDIE